MKRTEHARDSLKSRFDKRAKRIFTATTCAAAAAALVFAMVGCAPAGNSESGATSDHVAAQKAMVRAKRTNNLTTDPAAAQADSATVLVYMNGSDLESEAGEATTDIAEMLESNIGDNVNVVIETLGTKQWQNYGIASDHTQRYIVNKGELELVDDSLGQLDTTAPETLADFISWGVKNYPADRYMLVMWDHGGGPVYGFGYDEFQSDYAALTLDEIQEALEANNNVHFDFIGMDCCIMSSIETCRVLAPFCDYTILSEDFEPGIGWSYKNWMGMLEQNPSIGTVELGTAIVDDMVAAVSEDPENGEATLALIDESAVDALFNAWIDFAYENKDALLNTNYSQEVSQHGREGFEDEPARPNNSGNSENHAPGAMDSSANPFGFGYGMDMGDSSAWGDQDDWYGYNSGDTCGTCDSCEDCDSCDSCGTWDDWGGYDGFGDWGDSAFDSWGYDMSYVTMSDYYVTDIMAVASTIDSDKTSALKTAMDNAIVHYSRTEGDASMAGISVTLPYGDAEFYDELVDVFTACEIDSSYIEWLDDFVDAEGADNFYDFSSFEGFGGFGGPESFGGLGGFGGFEGAPYGSDSMFGGFGESGSYDDLFGYGESGSYGDLFGYGESGSYGDSYGFGGPGSFGGPGAYGESGGPGSFGGLGGSSSGPSGQGGLGGMLS